MPRIERRSELLSPFKHFWKTEDKEWALKRRSDWKIFENNGFKSCSKAENRVYKKYFLTGEWIAYIPESILFLLTPLSSQSDAKEFYYSKNFGPAERYKISNKYLRVVTRLGAGIDWLPKHIRFYVDGVLGHEYRLIEESQAHMKEVISPDPKFFCHNYFVDSKMLFSGEIAYHGCIEAVDYFVSALSHVDDPEIKNKVVINELFDLVNKALNDSNVDGVLRRFVEDLKENEIRIRKTVG